MDAILDSERGPPVSGPVPELVLSNPQWSFIRP